MTSYKSECKKFRGIFSVFINHASRFLMHRKIESSTHDDLDHQMGGLLLDNSRKGINRISERTAYRQFKKLLEFIKESKYIIEYVPYSDITHIIYDDSSRDTHDDIQQLIVYFWMKYRTEQENQTLSNPAESIQLNLELDWEFYSSFDQGQEQKLERTIYKIVEHIKLAILQRNHSIRERQHSLNLIDKEIKDKQNTLSELEDKITSFENSIDEKLRSNTLSMISVLGIFAAVLMGAFGAIQGFTSLFAHAYAMDLSMILIISSIGASAVILILFFLLNGIAKLTERSLWSTKKENGTLLEKHPSLVIVHGILIFIFLVGSALELSNVTLQFAWQGFWWAIPLFWISYLLTAVHKQDYLFFVDWFKRKR